MKPKRSGKASRTVWSSRRPVSRGRGWKFTGSPGILLSDAPKSRSRPRASPSTARTMPQVPNLTRELVIRRFCERQEAQLNAERASDEAALHAGRLSSSQAFSRAKGRALSFGGLNIEKVKLAESLIDDYMQKEPGQLMHLLDALPKRVDDNPGLVRQLIWLPDYAARLHLPSRKNWP